MITNNGRKVRYVAFLMGGSKLEYEVGVKGVVGILATTLPDHREAKIYFSDGGLLTAYDFDVVMEEGFHDVPTL
jgi:hypothetical protein